MLLYKKCFITKTTLFYYFLYTYGDANGIPSICCSTYIGNTTIANLYFF
jgi:hypothetical protein